MSAQDAWAVGWSYAVGRYGPVILHWNDRAWSRASAAGIACAFGGSAVGCELESVVAARRGEIWISSVSLTAVGGGLASYGLVYRLDGSAWVRIPVPAGLDPGALYSGPRGEIWMTGTGVAPAKSDGPVLAGWTGKMWRVSYTVTGSRYNVLQSLDVVSARNAWAAGYSQPGYSQFQEVRTPLLLHWNGVRWRSAPTPRVPAGNAGGGALGFVLGSARSPGIWATGTVYTGTIPEFIPNSRLLHWNGSKWATITMHGGSSFDLSGYEIGNISAGKSGAPQWAGGSTNTDRSWYLYNSGAGWTRNTGCDDTRQR